MLLINFREVSDSIRWDVFYNTVADFGIAMNPVGQLG